MTVSNDSRGHNCGHRNNYSAHHRNAMCALQLSSQSNTELQLGRGSGHKRPDGQRGNSLFAELVLQHCNSRELFRRRGYKR